MPFEIQAHRGARAFYPENTIQAFCKAAELGCRVIELDLVVSHDRRIVVSHDPWIPDPAGTGSPQRYLYSLSFEEISLFDCGMISPDFPAQKRISAFRPLLSEVFRAVEAGLCRIGRPGEMIYNLEVKSWEGKDGLAHPSPEDYASLVLQDISESGIADRIRLQSFDSRILIAAKRMQPELCYGLLVEERSVFDSFPLRPGFVPEYVNPSLSIVDSELIASMHELGSKVVVWTVNRREEMIRMRKIGADGIITDHPEVALHMHELKGE
jgi:glycerophosphoryl diester phosphodiesterase